MYNPKGGGGGGTIRIDTWEPGPWWDMLPNYGGGLRGLLGLSGRTPLRPPVENERGGGGGGQGGRRGDTDNPKSNAENYFRNFPCGNVINDVAKAAGKPTWQDTLKNSNFVSLTSNHPDWNKRMVDAGYSEDLLKEQGYSADMTLGEYFSQPKIIALTIPSTKTTYLGDRYRASNGRNKMQTTAHETTHQMFGTHLDVATALQKHAGFLPGVDLSKIPDEALSQQIDNRIFDSDCGKN
jgi:hypothetical protein